MYDFNNFLPWIGAGSQLVAIKASLIYMSKFFQLLVILDLMKLPNGFQEQPYIEQTAVVDTQDNNIRHKIDNIQDKPL